MSNTSGVIPQLLDVALHANNVEELSNFYARLGLRRAIDDDDLKVFILGTNELEIHRAHDNEDNDVTIHVRVDHIGRIEQTLRQQAIDFRASEEDGPSVQVRDPNGNLVSFVTAG